VIVQWGFLVMARMSEGRAILDLPDALAESARGVFYNPKMSLNRDVSVLFVNSCFPGGRDLRLCDLTAGTGVRSIRYALECPYVYSVTAIDLDAEAVKTAKQNVQLNRIEGKVAVLESDAVTFLAGNRDRYDLVDIDPYGSPVRFLESSVRSTNDGGVIAVTATDMGPLTGAKPVACLRKYGVWTARTEFRKELAVRTLVSTLARGAGKFDLGVSVVFAFASDHYTRVYAKVSVGRKAANESMATLGFLEYCNRCLWRKARSNLHELGRRCEGCGVRPIMIGPVWLGGLWDEAAVQHMIEHTATLLSNRLSDVQTLLSRIGAEAHGPPFHYTTDTIASKLGVKPPGLERLLSSLKDAGFSGTRTHFAPNGFRTDAAPSEISRVLPSLALKSQA